MIERIRQAAEPALVEVDAILEHYNGKRLAAVVSLLSAPRSQ
jgi:hypothetical protein